MYLKRIELCGFKSFADRSYLEFEPGISVIVGPNGCGKTNISDAIRWVMGEQSAKQIRGNRMEDVIFNGTRKRPAQSMSEVTLIFDNSQNILPLDYPEVTVTRRLFRSGESEYLINKSTCRLKDIRDLFLDTGLGNDAYSLMEQGKVEFIVSAKPEERRSLFEEAAGIAKYKARREEALHKLEKIDHDLLRLSDIVNEVKKQISALDTQVRKTRQYQKLKEELRLQEIAALAQNFSQLRNNRDSAAKELEETEKKHQLVSTEVHQRETALSSLHLALTEQDEILVRQHEKLSGLDLEIARGEEKIERAKENRQELQSRIEQLNRQITEKETAFQLREKEEKDLAGELAEIENQLAREKDKLKQEEARWLEIKKYLANILENIEQNRNQILHFAQKKAQIHNELTSHQVQNEHLNAKLEKLTAENAQLESQKEQLSQELKQLRETGELKNGLRNQLEEKWLDFIYRKEENRRLREKIQAELQERTKNMETQRTRKTALQEIEDDQSSLISGCQAVLQQNFPGIYGRVADILKVPEKLDKILEIYLGPKLFYLLAENSAVAEKAIEFLKFNESGWAGFLILDRLPETKTLDLPLAQNILPQISYEEKYTKAVQFLLGQIFLKDDTLYGEAFLQGGIFFRQQPGFLSRRREIEALQRMITGEEEKIKQFSEQLTLFTAAQQQLSQEEEELSGQLQTARIQIAELAKVGESKEENYRLLIKQLQIIGGEKDTTRQGSEEKQAIIARLEKSLEDNVLKEIELAENIKLLEQEKEKIKSEEEQVNLILTQTKVSLSQLQERNHHLKVKKDWLAEEKKNITGEIGQKKEETANSSRRIKEENNIQAQESQRIEELFVQKQTKESELEKIRQSRQAIQEKISTEESALRAARQSLTFEQEARHQSKMHYQQLHTEINHIQERLEQDYSVNAEWALTNLPEKILLSEEIEKLKRKIETLGAVNLAAPEEYTQLEERYKFLTTQQEDLLKAKEDLLKLIAKINSTTKENFQNTFNQVRQNFQNIFGQLFQGGEADLILTDNGNLLETGVDILVQPPGKKLQNINLLSGGEKALTAIALLFAFFLVKPTPFCLMDEVDAPLDDHNLNRFIQLMKAAVSKSQFLIITHNKKTMEIADLLYGVTMEESGISKIISVRFQKASLPLPEEPVLA